MSLPCGFRTEMVGSSLRATCPSRPRVGECSDTRNCTTNLDSVRTVHPMNVLGALGIVVVLAGAIAAGWWAWRVLHRPDYWWVNALAAGWRLVAVGIALAVVGGLIVAPNASAATVTFINVIVGVVIIAALVCGVTGRWCDPSRRRAPGLWVFWFCAGWAFGWFIGFSSAFYSQPNEFSGENVWAPLLLPVLRAAPLVCTTWLAGLLHIRWVRRVRSRNCARVDRVMLDEEMAV